MTVQLQQPLSGLKILDFSTLFPGPYATHILCDLGAEVLRVEAPHRPDLLKILPPLIEGESAAHLSINRNKNSVALDLRETADRDKVHELLQQYDILVEQFRPGVMAKYALDFNSLKDQYPQLIYCSITGYGQTGPLKDRAGHDINYLALSGLASYSGTTETGPVLSAVQTADTAGSHHAVMGILAAVISRSQHGQGCHIDISMSDCALSLNAMYGASFLATNQAPTYASEVLNGGHFYGYYQTLDRQYLSIGSLEPKFMLGFFQALGQPLWAARTTHTQNDEVQQLRQDIASLIAQKKLVEWQDIFEQIDVCVEPVLDLHQVKTHPHFQQRNMFIKTKTKSGKNVLQIGNPIKFSS